MSSAATEGLLDPQAAATLPDASAWVGANAGSGKTYVLVSRLVRLMLDGAAPEQLLCLTYTRTAAAEMQDRLFALLAEWALLDDAALRRAIGERLGDDAVPDRLARARVLFARALETPGGLRVQTIHAFCESLLKRFPLEAGLSPQFDLMDEDEPAALQADLIAGLLAAPHDAALAAAMRRLTRALNEADLAKLGRDLIARRSVFQGGDGDAHLVALAKELGFAGPPDPAALAETALRDFVSDADGLAAWLAAGSPTDERKAAALTDFAVAAREGDWPAAFTAVRAAVLKADGGRLKDAATKGRDAADPALFDRLTVLADAAARLEDQLRAADVYAMTEAVLCFAERLLAGYAAEKARRALLDYDDLIGVTSQLLSGARAAQWVLFKIDQGLSHILVDEAQDTSPAQWRVIRALADEFFADVSGHETPRTIFAVGDEKQSIFSFQGADPAEFDRQFRHFEAQTRTVGRPLPYVPLTRSRRSVPQILTLVDAVFGTQEACVGVTADGRPTEHSAHRAEEAGHVEVWPVFTTQAAADDGPLWQAPAAAEDGRQQLADRMAEKIAVLLADAEQNVTPADILILVRKRDGFVDDMMRALKRRQVPVAGADRMVLLEQMAVMDVLAALDVVLNPEDDLALAAVLRSPLGGFDEAQLFDLAHGRSGTLWAALQAAATDLPAARKTLDLLQWLRSAARHLPPHDVLAQFLGARGAQKALAARLGPEIDDPLGELLRLALAYEARHAASLQGFVHWLRQSGQEIKRDMERGAGAVRIMTVHGAKGLEAPIVFLPDTCRPPVKTSGVQDRMHLAEGSGPMWRAAKAFLEPVGAARLDEAQRRAAEEERRLLYVAMTRARDRLYVGGWLGKKASRAGQGPPPGCWYQMVADSLEAPDALAAGERPLPSKETDAAEVGPVPPIPDWLIRRPPAGLLARRHFGDKLFSPSALGAAVAEPPALSGEADTEILHTAAARGRLVHKLLECLPALPQPERLTAARAYVQRAAAAEDLPLDDAAQAALVDEALAIMRQPRLAALFGPAARAEVAVAGTLPMAGGQVLALSGQIDRMVEADGRLLLVDFKTGRPSSDAAAAGRFLRQMAAYRALMLAIEPQRPVDCALVWTQTGAVEFLAEADLQAAMADILAGRADLA